MSTKTIRAAVSAAAVAVVLLVSGCAAPVTEAEGGDRATPTVEPTPTSSPTPSDDDSGDSGDSGGDSGDDSGGDSGDSGGSDDGGDDQGGSDSDGGADPAQDRVRSGPVAQYGGPAYGDQGEAEIVEDGVWCKTIAVFWGGDQPVPEGVRFTFQSAVPDRGGLTAEGGVCGTRGADQSCLGLTMEANGPTVFCSLVVRPGEGFQDGTAITFAGTLECPTSEVCDQVASRAVEPGPPIVVNTPEGA